MNVHLPGGIDVVGFDYWPASIQPGDAVQVTLYVQATRAVTEEFLVVVQAVSPAYGVGLARESRMASDLVQDGWTHKGTVITTSFILSETSDWPMGAYDIDVTAVKPDDEAVLAIYQRKDPFPLDHTTLGEVVVPWRGSLGEAEVVGANLANEMRLLAFEVEGKPSPGSELGVTLYWEALLPPGDDYVVFVHLLDGQGQPVAGHDGPPVNRRYPTGTWRPGDIIPDAHSLVLDPGLPPGTYRLLTGMYRWPSGKRLPVRDSEGVEQPNGVVVLGSIQVQ
jgi:hypothetical protein